MEIPIPGKMVFILKRFPGQIGSQDGMHIELYIQFQLCRNSNSSDAPTNQGHIPLWPRTTWRHLRIETNSSTHDKHLLDIDGVAK